MSFLCCLGLSLVPGKAHNHCALCADCRVGVVHNFGYRDVPSGRVRVSIFKMLVVIEEWYQFSSISLIL